jgi:dUTP pyrophosphatase
LLKIKKLRPDAQPPTLAYNGAIGYDLYAAEDASIPPHQTVAVPTGISIEFEPRAGAILGTRSGMARRGFSTEGGWIDADYRGEVLVLLSNRNHEVTLEVKKGDRIAQMTRVEICHDEVVEAEDLTETARGANGFGSSGK